ncbi:DUF4236 domain-containing protein [Streptomyces sp. NPDC003374]
MTKDQEPRTEEVWGSVRMRLIRERPVPVSRAWRVVTSHSQMPSCVGRPSQLGNDLMHARRWLERWRPKRNVRRAQNMGFSYRKSFKAGPFRVTASKSGISYSAGVKGVRVTKRANGRVQTTLSAPGTGLRYTTRDL